MTRSVVENQNCVPGIPPKWPDRRIIQLNNRRFDMDYSIIIICAVLVAGVAGFTVLARSVLSNWKAGSRGKEEVDALQTKRNKEEVERERQRDRQND
jgi:hypothetical protein